MTSRPSTIRSSDQHTVEDSKAAGDIPSRADRILRFWQEQADASVLRTVEAFPDLQSHRSLLLDLAVEEFKLKAATNGISAKEYCQRFQRFGDSIEHSIFRAIEVQAYIDCHPELMELVVDFEWPQPGDSLQGFVVLEELGRGATARAFLCRESELGGREVVVKVARGNGFEAELIARLDHPNIVPVYSVVNDDERYVSYICMPFRGRSTLQQLVEAVEREIPVDCVEIVRLAAPQQSQGFSHGTYVDGVVDLATKLADALCHAHLAGVLHGDLKPSNVLLTPAVEPLLIDFNLARDQRSGIAPCGGTLAYMPPEIIQGICEGDVESRVYDVRSEVYSFGALLYALLVGDLPYPAKNDADTVAVARQLNTSHETMVPSLRSHNRVVNRGLEQLVLDCLAINPALRPGSMQEIRRRLKSQRSTSLRLVRKLSAHPTVFRTIATLGMVVSAALVMVFALRPTHAMRELRRGITFSERGEFPEAIGALSNARDDKVTGEQALRYRALAYLGGGDPKRAAKDFYQLFVETRDGRAAALIGYCYNLQKEHSAAIAWYEKALSGEFETAALRNNLGISYAICQSGVGHEERYDLATKNLTQALELNGSLLAARRNLVEVAVLRDDRPAASDAKSVASNAEFLLSSRGNDPGALILACRAFGLLSTHDARYADRCFEVVESALAAGVGPSQSELTHSKRFAVLRARPAFSDLISRAPESLAPGIQHAAFELPVSATDFTSSGAIQSTIDD